MQDSKPHRVISVLQWGMLPMCIMFILPFVYGIFNSLHPNFLVTDATYKVTSNLSCSNDITMDGFINMRAAQFALHQIGSMTGANYSLLYIPHCSSDAILTTTFTSIIDKDQQNFNLMDMSGNKHRVPISKTLAAVVGQDSSKTMIVDNFLWKHNVLVISTGITSEWLNNRNQYFMLKSFVPTNQYLVDVLLATLIDLGLQTFALVYSNNPDGRSAEQLISQIAPPSGLCMGYQMMVDENIDSLRVVAQTMATQEKYPRVTVMYVEPKLKALLMEQIKAFDLYWERQGRIMIIVGGFPPGRDDLRGFFKGSLGIDSNMPLEWEMLPESFDNYASRFTLAQASENKIFIQAWQQLGQCHFSDPGIANRLILSEYDQTCDTSCPLWGKNADSSCLARFDKPDLNSRIAKQYYLAVYAIGLAIDNTPLHKREQYYCDKASMMNDMDDLMMPEPLDDIRIFKRNSEYSITSVEYGTEVFRYAHGVLEKVENPTFYFNQKVDYEFTSPCDVRKRTCVPLQPEPTITTPEVLTCHSDTGYIAAIVVLSLVLIGVSLGLLVNKYDSQLKSFIKSTRDDNQGIVNSRSNHSRHTCFVNFYGFKVSLAIKYTILVWNRMA